MCTFAYANQQQTLMYEGKINFNNFPLANKN